MSILLIAISFILTLANFYIWEWTADRNKTGEFRIAVIKTAIIYGVIISVLTEILSVWRSLNFASVVTFWLVFSALNLLGLKSKLVKKVYPGLINKSKSNFKRPELIATIAILSICLVTAIMAPPNNWDVMTYHMPRVMHWTQNQSIAHYPTNNTRQISFPAGAAYIVTQFQILTGSDLFANCVQWLAFFGSIVGTSLITNALVGASTEWIGALVCASVPMAIMQSTTAQTDLVVAFWLVCFTYFIFRTENYSKSDLFWLAASLGLGILTKPTAIIFGLPLFVVFLIRALRHHLKISRNDFPESLSKVSSQAIAISVGALFLSIPGYWRNYQTFGSFLGNDGNGTRNDVLGLPQLVSNALKYLGINFPIPGFWSVIKSIHEFILHVNFNDPNLNFTDTSKYTTLTGSLRFLTPNEDFVGSPIHLVLFLLSIWMLIAHLFKQQRSKKTEQNSQIDRDWNPTTFLPPDKQFVEKPHVDELIVLGAIAIVGFLVFCFLLKWQPWGNRLLLPLPILSSTAIAYLLTRISSKNKKIILVFLASTSIIYALTTMKHPLVSLPVLTSEQGKEQSESILLLKRQDIYFSGVKKELKIPYQTASDLINQAQCKHVGFALGYDDIEYPLWQLLDRDIQIKNFNVKNLSSQASPEFPDRQLCAIISTGESFLSKDLLTDLPKDLSETEIRWQNITVSQSPYVIVYKRMNS
jgi:4-amino-4-deoxy-L-arabinose transferase-like glycosyltransferase